MSDPLDGIEPVRLLRTPVRLEFTVRAGHDLSGFLRALRERRIVGQRCPSCRKVYVPPRGSCPQCGVATQDDVEIGHAGTVQTFCIVNIPYEGQEIPIPYTCASVMLDGADIEVFGLLHEVAPGDVRTGMRVEAVWVDDDALAPTLESIRWYRPVTGAGSDVPENPS